MSQPMAAMRHLFWQFGWRDRLRVLFRGVVWHEVFMFDQSLQPQKLSAKKPIMENQAHE